MLGQDNDIYCLCPEGFTGLVCNETEKGTCFRGPPPLSLPKRVAVVPVEPPSCLGKPVLPVLGQIHLLRDSLGSRVTGVGKKRDWFGCIG